MIRDHLRRELLGNTLTFYGDHGGVRLAKRGGRVAIRKVLSVCHRSDIGVQRTDAIPTIIYAAASDVVFKTQLSPSLYPTRDAVVNKPDTLPPQPIVGVLSGPWDLFREPWKEVPLYQSLEERFLERKSWKETQYYRERARKINQGEPSWSLSSIDELDQRCEDIDSLYDSMKADGYVPQETLIKRGADVLETASPRTISIFGESYPDECRVGIGRNGEIIRLGGGLHRLSVAKILDIDDVPLLVVVRHRKWKRKREKIATTGSIDDLGEWGRQYLDHPDMQDVLPENKK